MTAEKQRCDPAGSKPGSTSGKWALRQTRLLHGGYPRAWGDEAGKRLAAFPGVTHCYERGAVPGRWDYTHYTVHHGRSRDDVTAEVKKCAEMTELDEYTVIFSTEELKRVPVARVSENGGELQ